MDDWVLILVGVLIGIPVGVVIIRLAAPQATYVAPQTRNKEVWQYVDWQGIKRSIEVHREVE